VAREEELLGGTILFKQVAKKASLQKVSTLLRILILVLKPIGESQRRRVAKVAPFFLSILVCYLKVIAGEFDGR